MGPTRLNQDQTSRSWLPKGKPPTHWIWSILKSYSGAHKSELSLYNFCTESRLGFLASIGQWVPLFPNPRCPWFLWSPRVPHKMAGLDLQSNGQMGPTTGVDHLHYFHQNHATAAVYSCRWWPTGAHLPCVHDLFGRLGIYSLVHGPDQSHSGPGGPTIQRRHVSVFHQTVAITMVFHGFVLHPQLYHSSSDVHMKRNRSYPNQ